MGLELILQHVVKENVQNVQQELIQTEQLIQAVQHVQQDTILLQDHQVVQNVQLVHIQQQELEVVLNVQKELGHHLEQLAVQHV